jgi:hypothetical protein
LEDLIWRRGPLNGGPSAKTPLFVPFWDLSRRSLRRPYLIIDPLLATPLQLLSTAIITPIVNTRLSRGFLGVPS